MTNQTKTPGAMVLVPCALLDGILDDPRLVVAMPSDTLVAIKAALAAPAVQPPAVGGEPEVEWPDFHDQGMGCGLEDRGITDRYEAMRYGWGEALERCASEVVAPLLAEIQELRNRIWSVCEAEESIDD